MLTTITEKKTVYNKAYKATAERSTYWEKMPVIPKGNINVSGAIKWCVLINNLTIFTNKCYSEYEQGACEAGWEEVIELRPIVPDVGNANVGK